MAHTVSAREANQHFSDILGKAARGETIVITRRGEPIARLVPYADAPANDMQGRAWDRLITTLEEGIPLGGEPFDRDSLYDR